MGEWMTATPISDPISWLRFFAGLLIIVILPGSFLIYKRAAKLGPLWSLGLSFAIGMLVAPVYARLTNWLSLPYEPIGHTIFSCLGMWLLGRSAALDELMQRVTEPLITEQRWHRVYELGIVASMAYIAVTLVVAFGDLPAPPHVHDASNHAFLVQRIADLRSTDFGEIFTAPFGSPQVGYLLGWHSTAALISRTSGLAPYVTMWQLGLASLVLLPLTLAILWRHWSLTPAAVAVAAFLVSGLDANPFTDLNWGGFGMLIGFSLAPVVAVFCVQAIATRALPAIAALSVLVASLVHIHAGGVVTAFLLALASWHSMRRTESKRRWTFAHLGVVALVGLLVAGVDLWRLAGDYRGMRMVPPAGDPASLQHILLRIWRRVARDEWTALLLLFGWVVFMARRNTRPAGIVFFGMALVFTTLSRFRDPVSLFLTTPYYQTPGRLLTPMLPLTIPMVYALPLWLSEHARRNWQRFILAAGILILLFPSTRHGRASIRREFRSDRLRSTVPFSRGDFALARQIPGRVPPEGLVANFWDDGSTWAMHVSGRHFLLPVSWHLGVDDDMDHRPAVRALLDAPWNEEARGLRDLGVTHLFMSDTALGVERGSGQFHRGLVANDPRFCEELRGTDSSLYRIIWEQGEIGGMELESIAGFGKAESWGRWAMEELCQIRVELAREKTELVVSTAAFEGMEIPQRCELSLDGKRLGEFTVRGRPWDWQQLAFELPASVSPRTATIEFRFAGRWQPTSAAGARRALPFQFIRQRQADACVPEVVNVGESLH